MLFRSLLTHNTPTYPWQPTPGDLSLRYRYKRFMPKGILTRFIVEQHKRIENVSEPDRAHVWKTGVILIDQNTRAEIIEKYSDREIILRFTGPHQRNLLTQLKTTLDDIHEDFTRPDGLRPTEGHRPTTQKPLDYEIVIPCNCTTCTISNKPDFFSLENLYNFTNKRIDTIQCRESGNTINVRSLLDNTIDRNYERRDRYSSMSYDERSDRYDRKQELHVHITPTFNNNNQQEQTIVNDNKTWTGDRIDGNKYEINNSPNSMIGEQTIQGDNIQGNKIVNSQNLAQAAADIKTLFNQISATDTTTNPTLVAIEAIKEIEKNPTLKGRLVNAGKEAGYAAFEAAVEAAVANPAVKIVTAAIKGAIEA